MFGSVGEFAYLKSTRGSSVAYAVDALSVAGLSLPVITSPYGSRRLGLGVSGDVTQFRPRQRGEDER